MLSYVLYKAKHSIFRYFFLEKSYKYCRASLRYINLSWNHESRGLDQNKCCPCRFGLLLLKKLKNETFCLIEVFSSSARPFQGISLELQMRKTRDPCKNIHAIHQIVLKKVLLGTRGLNRWKYGLHKRIFKNDKTHFYTINWIFRPVYFST